MPTPESIQRGQDVLKELFGSSSRNGDLPAAFQDLTVGNLFGDVWARGGMSLQERSMVTVAALAVLNMPGQMESHLKGAKHVGIPREKLEEMMMHLAHYGGWPCGVQGLRAVARVFDAAP